MFKTNSNGLRASIVIRAYSRPGGTGDWVDGGNAPNGDPDSYLAGALLAIAGIPLPPSDSDEYKALPDDYVFGYKDAIDTIHHARDYAKNLERRES